MDSERIAVRVDAIVLADLGWPLSEAEIIERFVGRSEEHIVREIEAHLGHSLPKNWEDAYQSLYTEEFETELKAVDGVVDALDQITTATCVASSGSHDKIRRSLRLTNLYKRFEGRILSLVPGMGPWVSRGYTPGISPGGGAHDDDSPSPPGSEGGCRPLLGLRPGADMRRKLVPLARRHAVQAKVAVVVDRTVHRAALILMHVGSDKRRLGRPHRSGEHPRDAICAVLAHEQTVALPFVLFQHVNAKQLQHVQQGVHGALDRNDG